LITDSLNKDIKEEILVITPSVFALNKLKQPLYHPYT